MLGLTDLLEKEMGRIRSSGAKHSSQSPLSPTSQEPKPIVPPPPSDLETPRSPSRRTTSSRLTSVVSPIAGTAHANVRTAPSEDEKLMAEIVSPSKMVTNESTGKNPTSTQLPNRPQQGAHVAKEPSISRIFSLSGAQTPRASVEEKSQISTLQQRQCVNESTKEKLQKFKSRHVTETSALEMDTADKPERTEADQSNGVFKTDNFDLSDASNEVSQSVLKINGSRLHDDVLSILRPVGKRKSLGSAASKEVGQGDAATVENTDSGEQDVRTNSAKSDSGFVSFAEHSRAISIVKESPVLSSSNQLLGHHSASPDKSESGKRKAETFSTFSFFDEDGLSDSEPDWNPLAAKRKK